jgi:hypothetical protein
MTKLDQLNMNYNMAYNLGRIPVDYRTRNHTDYYTECKQNVDILVEELKLDPKEWEIPGCPECGVRDTHKKSCKENFKINKE